MHGVIIRGGIVRARAPCGGGGGKPVLEQPWFPHHLLEPFSRRPVIVACDGMGKEAQKQIGDDGCGARNGVLVSRLKAWRNDLPRLKMGASSQPERALREKQSGISYRAALTSFRQT